MLNDAELETLALWRIDESIGFWWKSALVGDGNPFLEDAIDLLPEVVEGLILGRGKYLVPDTWSNNDQENARFLLFKLEACILC